jgi:adenylosuccinate synthase
VADRLHVVAVSGPVGAGKTTLAKRLADRYGGRRISTRELIVAHAHDAGETPPDERRAFQEYGEGLDRHMGGTWVSEAAASVVARHADARLVIVDAVRTRDQVEALRSAFGTAVTHVHVHAPDDVLSDRYATRGSTPGLTELGSYSEVTQSASELEARKLLADADVAIDTQQCSPDDVETRAAAALGLLATRTERLVDVIVGAQYGSEGKGNIAFYLASDYDVLVRVGGPNAGHKVPLPTPFTHRLLPSGTRANESAHLVIGPGATIDLPVLQAEIADCSVESDRLTIDPQAMIIRDHDIAEEAALVNAIGSTGKGGGAAAARRITDRHPTCGRSPVELARDLPELRAYVRPAAEVLDAAYRNSRRVLLEGTQGTALSLYHGHYPYVTSRDTTTAGCLAEAGIGPHRVRKVVLVARTYPIRVESPSGRTSGPMSQEITYEDVAARSGIPLEELRTTEKGSVSSKQRRIGEFDWQLLQRAVELNSATDIALTFTDYLDARNREARRYEQLATETIRFVEEVERVAGVPVSLLTTRFDVRGIIDRRRW